LQEATACDLVLFSGTTSIAKGMVHPPAAGDQLMPNHLRVTVDRITEEWAVKIPLPVPEEDKFLLEDALHATVQWPKNNIILEKVISK